MLTFVFGYYFPGWEKQFSHRLVTLGHCFFFLPVFSILVQLTDFVYLELFAL